MRAVSLFPWTWLVIFFTKISVVSRQTRQRLSQLNSCLAKSMSSTAQLVQSLSQLRAKTQRRDIEVLSAASQWSPPVHSVSVSPAVACVVITSLPSAKLTNYNWAGGDGAATAAVCTFVHLKLSAAAAHTYKFPRLASLRRCRPSVYATRSIRPTLCRRATDLT